MDKEGNRPETSNVIPITNFNYSPDMFHEKPMLGLVYGILFSIPIWAVLGLAVYLLSQH
jgi:hypothetical protein